MVEYYKDYHRMEGSWRFLGRGITDRLQRVHSLYLEPVTSIKLEWHLSFKGGLPLLNFYKKLYKLKSVVTARNREESKAALLGW